MKKVLLTGMTARANGTGINKYITVQDPLADILCDLGYEVERKAVYVGDDLSEYEIIICFLLSPGKLVTTYYFGIFDAIRRYPDKVILSFDDWQYYKVQRDTESMVKSGYFEKHIRIGFVNKRDTETLREHPELIEKIKGTAYQLSKDLTWPVLFPKFSWGLKEIRLATTGPVSFFDPSIYCIDAIRLNQKFCEIKSPKGRQKRWTLGSLFNHDKFVKSLNLTWPVEQLGHRKTQEVVSEEQLSFFYGHSWGIISPGYPTSGDGWWRMRWVFAAYYHNIILATPNELGNLPIDFLPEIGEIENATLQELTDISLYQAGHLYNSFMDKEESLRIVKEVLCLVT